jgi:hypothetical protein
MSSGFSSLGDAATRLSMLRLECSRCGPSGQYRIDKLLERFGPDIALPDLRHELAQCPRRGSMGDPCQVGYVDWLGDLPRIMGLRLAPVRYAEPSPKGALAEEQ